MNTPTHIKNGHFADYVLGFYGPNGIYPMGATKNQVLQALDKLIKSGADVAYDSIDREKVRDLLIADFDLKFPSQANKGQ